MTHDEIAILFVFLTGTSVGVLLTYIYMITRLPDYGSSEESNEH